MSVMMVSGGGWGVGVRVRGSRVFSPKELVLESIVRLNPGREREPLIRAFSLVEGHASVTMVTWSQSHSPTFVG